jgi:hypothetical protein
MANFFLYSIAEFDFLGVYSNLRKFYTIYYRIWRIPRHLYSIFTPSNIEYGEFFLVFDVLISI